jgi:N-acetylmuramoyl-L-alanine amidase
MKLYLNIHSLFFLILISLLSTNTYSQAPKKFTLVVDAGHGGHDPGTMGNKKYKKYEKDVALSIALRFGNLVTKNMKDVKVVYTRKTDVFIKLVDRPRIANKNNADLFVSIHCNANNNKAVNGSETYVLGPHKNKANFEVAKKENSVIFLEEDYSMNYEGFDPNSISSIVGLTIGQEQYLENSLLLASLIQTNFKTKTALRSRGTNGVKQAGFWVLAHNYMPSVLVETGFLSNDKDARILMSEKGKNQVANALYLAFKEYKKYLDNQSGLSADYAYEPTEVVKKQENKEPIKAGKVVKKETKKVVKTKTTTPKKVTSKKTVKVKEDIYEYAIQISSSKRKLSLNDAAFKGLSNVSYYKSGNIYKYIYNKSSNYQKVLSSRGIVNKKGFKGNFVVAFKNGKRLALSKALKEDKNNS